MVEQLGMSKLGFVNYTDQDVDGITKSKVYEEIKRITDQAEANTHKVLSEKILELQALSEELLIRRTMTGQEVKDFLLDFHRHHGQQISMDFDAEHAYTPEA